MKKLLMATAALALLTTAARADDVRTATMMSIASFYDRDCAKIPGLQPMIKEMLAQIPADLAVAGLARGREVYLSMGTAKFCENYKPVIDNAVRGIR
jgi:hypothetical protein